MADLEPIADPLMRMPPTELSHRGVRLDTDGVHALRVPADPADHPPEPWYPASVKFTDRNSVRYTIDGADTFALIAKAMRRARKKGHFIYILGWWFELDIAIGYTTPRALLQAAADAGVEIRAMIYNNRSAGSAGQQIQADMVSFVQDLHNGWAVLDERIATWPTGAHHQKLIVVGGVGGVTALVGGLDLNSDRLVGPKPPDSPGSPLHDVHCQVQGPGALDLLQVFSERWLDHPNAGHHPLKAFFSGLGGAVMGAAVGTTIGPFGTLVGLVGGGYYGSEVGSQGAPEPLTPPRPQSGTGDFFVGVARTYANGTAHPFGPPWSVGSRLFGFAPTGVRTCKDLLLNAIGNAKRFVYIEDQYFFSPDATDALVAALQGGVEHVTVLVTWPSYLLPLMNDHRDECLRLLRAAGGRRFRLFFLTPEQGRHTYVHSKLTIVDDEFVSIGSCNYNRRSFTNDSEVLAGMVDQHSPDDVVYNLAHRLRIKMWAEHLNMDTPSGYAELADGVGSAVHWLDPPPGAKVVPYDVLNHPDLDTSALVAAANPYLGLVPVEYLEQIAPVSAAQLEQWLSDILEGHTVPLEGEAFAWGFIDPDGS